MNERYYQAVIELINAYERGLILSLNKKHTETTPKILMMAPLLTMEAAIETSELGFDLNFADVASRTQNSYKEPVFEQKSFAVKDANTGATTNVQNNKKELKKTEKKRKEKSLFLFFEFAAQPTWVNNCGNG